MVVVRIKYENLAKVRFVLAATVQKNPTVGDSDCDMALPR
jgi:hypothetical protein